MRLKAASILVHYLGNAKKVVPQNMHFIVDLFDYKLYYWSVLYGRLQCSHALKNQENTNTSR